MSKYRLIEDGTHFETVEAESAEAALADFDPDAGDYNTSDGTVWTTIRARGIGAAEGDDASRDYQIDQDEPDCSASEHDWRSPFAVLGGLRENPGVLGKGGGVIMTRCCLHCGAQKQIDTWAQNPSDGTQGHTVTSYTAGHYSDDEAWQQWRAELLAEVETDD